MCSQSVMALLHRSIFQPLPVQLATFQKHASARLWLPRPPPLPSPPLTAVVLDDCNFHDSVQLDSFESERTLVLLPPEGEFVAMNYRTSSEFKPPFRVVAQIEETTPMKARRALAEAGRWALRGVGGPAWEVALRCEGFSASCMRVKTFNLGPSLILFFHSLVRVSACPPQIEVILKLIADFPAANTASTVIVQLPLPKTTSHVSLSTSGSAGQSAEYLEQSKMLSWTFRKIQGGSDHLLRAKVALTQERQSNVRKEVRTSTHGNAAEAPRREKASL